MEVLRSLRVYLTTEPVEWLRSFRDSQGLTQLTAFLNNLERDRYGELHLEDAPSLPRLTRRFSREFEQRAVFHP